MCYSFNIKGLVFNNYKARREIVESIARLNDWIFDEIAFYQDDPKLSKKKDTIEILQKSILEVRK
jgi:hypothetical protein